ncbi:MAG: WYL domain-containing protein [Syntrophomonadaceae bacterium]|jgi:predicted DNA-binding transcriptional regulator YafY|nr:WYL domain-containing protein [Syntrophomonadaceae bacterium]
MNTRKDLPKTALPRIYFIDREIAAGKYPNTRYLAEKYEAGTASISRDIEFMRDMLGAPIAYDAARRGYYYTDKTFRLAAGFTTKEDMLALGMVKSLMSLYKGTPLYASVLRLLEEISIPTGSPETSPKTPPENNTWYEDRLVAAPISQAHVDPPVWTAILSSLKENRTVSFEYRGIWDNDYKTRVVRPYQLLFDNGAWFLYGFSVERSAVRMFSLSRMRGVRYTNEIFTLPSDFDFTRHTGGSYFGIFIGMTTYRFSIEFFHKAAIEVPERYWALDQDLQYRKNSVVLSFTSTQYDKVLEWLLSHGRDAQPLEPPKLVNDWKKHIESLAVRVQNMNHIRKVIFFDTETNGLSKNSSVLSISAIKAVYNGVDIDFIEAAYNRYYFRNPGEQPLQEAIFVNGLTDETIAKRRGNADYPLYFKDDMENFKTFCGDARHFVAHNIAFDSKFLDFPLQYAFCTMRENKRPFKKLDGNGHKTCMSLSETAKYYQAEVQNDALHSSDYDTQLVHGIFRKMLASEDTKEKVLRFLEKV